MFRLLGALKINRKGLTVLELIVVIIVIAVLVTLALPQLNKAVEASYAAEALANARVIKDAVARCMYFNTGTFEESRRYCRMASVSMALGGSTVDISNPERAPGAKFYYQAWYIPERRGGISTDLTILAVRKFPGGGADYGSTIRFLYRANGEVWRRGRGYYSSLSTHDCWFRGCR